MTETIDNRIRRIANALAKAGFYWASNDLNNMASEINVIIQERDGLKSKLQVIINLFKEHAK